MNQYFFKLTNEEKNNILDQHKHQYDGYATKQSSPKEQPLFVQDYANDKNGITVNNKGDVMNYRNVSINENFMSLGKQEETEIEDEFNEEYQEFEEEEEVEQYEKVDYLGHETTENVLSNIEDGMEYDQDEVMVKESVLKTLNWFKRLK